MDHTTYGFQKGNSAGGIALKQATSWSKPYLRLLCQHAKNHPSSIFVLPLKGICGVRSETLPLRRSCQMQHVQGCVPWKATYLTFEIYSYNTLLHPPCTDKNVSGGCPATESAVSAAMLRFPLRKATFLSACVAHIHPLWYSEHAPKFECLMARE